MPIRNVCKQRQRNVVICVIRNSGNNNRPSIERNEVCVADGIVCRALNVKRTKTYAINPRSNGIWKSHLYSFLIRDDSCSHSPQIGYGLSNPTDRVIDFSDQHNVGISNQIAVCSIRINVVYFLR